MTGYKFRRPCLGCGALVTGASRCDTCAAVRAREVDAKRDKGKRVLYGGDYAQRAKEVRESAQVCWLCGAPARDGDPWQADHLVPDDPLSPLLPAHRSCNIRRALEQRNRNKRTR